MREIEFRLRYKDKSWFYGVPLSKIKEDTVAFKSFDGNYYDLMAIATTLGQYTGLCDKNGTKIFEGDIVKVYLAYKTIVCIVKWEDCGYVLQDIKIQDYKYSMGKSFELEVIGNIYDNPELLEVADGR